MMSENVYRYFNEQSAYLSIKTKISGLKGV